MPDTILVKATPLEQAVTFLKSIATTIKGALPSDNAITTSALIEALQNAQGITVRYTMHGGAGRFGESHHRAKLSFSGDSEQLAPVISALQAAGWSGLETLYGLEHSTGKRCINSATISHSTSDGVRPLKTFNAIYEAIVTAQGDPSLIEQYSDGLSDALTDVSGGESKVASEFVLTFGRALY